MRNILKILALVCLIITTMNLAIIGESFSKDQQMGVGIAAAFVVLGFVLIWAAPEEES